MTLTFAKLRDASERRTIEWSMNQPDLFDLSFYGNELGGECGEAQNVIKKLERERLGAPGSRSTKERLAEELADVVIVADLIAAKMKIDLGEAVRNKFNDTSDKNGFKSKISP